MSGELPGGHSLGFQVGSYLNESFPEALLKLSQPAVGSGVEDALGDAAADVEAETAGVAGAEDPEGVVALVPQAVTPAPRRTRAAVLTKVQTPVVLFIA
jgi:hypothetical protein